MKKCINKSNVMISFEIIMVLLLSYWVMLPSNALSITPDIPKEKSGLLVQSEQNVIGLKNPNKLERNIESDVKDHKVGLIVQSDTPINDTYSPAPLGALWFFVCCLVGLLLMRRISLKVNV